MQSINAQLMKDGKNVELTGNLSRGFFQTRTGNVDTDGPQQQPLHWYTDYMAMNSSGEIYRDKRTGEICLKRERENISGLAKAERYHILKIEYQRTGQRPPLQKRTVSPDWATQHSCTLDILDDQVTTVMEELSF